LELLETISIIHILIKCC